MPTGAESYVSVLPKAGKDPTTPSSYRPISLINIDSKILTLILSRRLARILPTIIHPAQQGFIKGRSAVTNIRKVLIVLEQARTARAADMAIVMLDAEKAFDSVQLPWLFQVLDKMWFEGRLLSFLHMLFKAPTTRVLTTGALSAPISLQRGTRQGCPLSPLLFNIAMEPLSLLQQQSQKLHVIRVRAQEIRTALFADDIRLFTSSPQADLPYIQEIFDKFRDISGLQINYTKSKILPPPNTD